MFATYAYSSPGRPQPPLNVASYEKTTIDESDFEDQAEPSPRNMDTSHTRATSESRRSKRED
jgi:hypothetical protein